MGRENQLTTYVSAKRPIIYINHYDYREIDNFIEEAVSKISDKEIYEYRAIGAVNFKTKKIQDERTDLFNFLSAYYIFGNRKNIFLVIKDVDEELKNPSVTALIKRIAEMNVYNSGYNCTIIIVSQNIQVPKELEDYISIIEIPKLSGDEIEKYILSVAEEKNIKVNEKDLGEIAISLKGLSKWYITQILNMMDIISTSNINKIIKEKGQIIKKSGILELIDFKEKASDIGGLENLKEWLNNKAKIFRRLDEARKFGVDTPKGVLLVGMPGCGKSLTAKAASRMFNVPLLRLDIGRLLGKYVGESEHNLRMALKMSESISPCILWIDEIEKAFAGINQSGGASDITKRLFGQFLTWLQEKENTVFVVATANDISCFPPEFLRKGRFDEIFYVDFPNKDEREEIFRIHLEKRGKYNKEFIDLEKIAEKTDGFCGADIEEVVKVAVEQSFLEENENIKTEKILEIIENTDSMKSILSEKIDALKKAYKKFKLKSASSNGKNKNGNTVFVQGGKYIPSYENQEIKVFDLYVGKYEVTQNEWEKYMKENPSKFKGRRKPVENVSWLQALEFCNKMSEDYGLKPVYKIENNELRKIIYTNGTEVSPNTADFERTEGYRLPTEAEWEWFARGGETVIQNGTFDTKYSGSNNLDEVGWYEKNSEGETHVVGTKKPNELGLYDCTGNVSEWCYNTNLSKEKNKGGSYCSSEEICEITSSVYKSSSSGFRVVRTAEPKKINSKEIPATKVEGAVVVPNTKTVNVWSVEELTNKIYEDCDTGVKMYISQKWIEIENMMFGWVKFPNDEIYPSYALDVYENDDSYYLFPKYAEYTGQQLYKPEECIPVHLRNEQVTIEYCFGDSVMYNGEHFIPGQIEKSFGDKKINKILKSFENVTLESTFCCYGDNSSEWILAYLMKSGYRELYQVQMSDLDYLCKK